jgi:hypothetical protein
MLGLNSIAAFARSRPMPTHTYSCRQIVGGVAEGPALVADTRISFWGGFDPASGEIVEVGNPFEGVSIAGKVIVFRSTKGSSGTSLMLRLAKMAGHAPLAFINTELDELSTLACVALGLPLVTDLDVDPFVAMQTGDIVRVDADRGVVEVSTDRPSPPRRDAVSTAPARSTIDLTSEQQDMLDGAAVDRRQITGPLPSQIAQALTYLQVSPLNPTASRKDGRGRHDYPSYVDRSLQEAIVNAVVHRDYEVQGSQIIIRLFPDRIEFQNPGALYNTLTVENLYAGCQPVRRNQLLAGFLRAYKSAVTGGRFLEAMGEGFLNLVRDSERLSGRRPELTQIGQATKLTIYAATYEGDRGME